MSLVDVVEQFQFDINDHAHFKHMVGYGTPCPIPHQHSFRCKLRILAAAQ